MKVFLTFDRIIPVLCRQYAEVVDYLFRRSRKSKKPYPKYCLANSTNHSSLPTFEEYKAKYLFKSALPRSFVKSFGFSSKYSNWNFILNRVRPWTSSALLRSDSLLKR